MSLNVFIFQMLGLNIESNLSPKTAWLQSYLGLSSDGVANVLKSFPAVLALNVENLEGKVRLGATVAGAFSPCAPLVDSPPVDRIREEQNGVKG